MRRLRNVCTVGQRDRFARARKVAFEVEHGVDGAVEEDALLGMISNGEDGLTLMAAGAIAAAPMATMPAMLALVMMWTRNPFVFGASARRTFFGGWESAARVSPQRMAAARLRQVGGVAHK